MHRTDAASGGPPTAGGEPRGPGGTPSRAGQPPPTGESELLARIAALESRLAELEARQSSLEGEARLDLDSILARVFGTEAVGHMKAARREDLLTLRAMLDTWIERLDRARDTRPPKPPPRRRESITLE